ncbi:MAG: hypothetical protein SFU99_23450 [Saprospiraceae bacterium]|nr:hypothetical protein [Saprospiraceae bacterium]
MDSKEPPSKFMLFLLSRTMKRLYVFLILFITLIFIYKPRHFSQSKFVLVIYIFLLLSSLLFLLLSNNENNENKELEINLFITSLPLEFKRFPIILIILIISTIFSVEFFLGQYLKTYIMEFIVDSDYDCYDKDEFLKIELINYIYSPPRIYKFDSSAIQLNRRTLPPKLRFKVEEFYRGDSISFKLSYANAKKDCYLSNSEDIKISLWAFERTKDTLKLSRDERLKK